MFGKINDPDIYFLDNSLVKEIRKLKTTRNLLIVGIFALVLAAFCAPVPVMVGDVCLSCWGK